MQLIQQRYDAAFGVDQWQSPLLGADAVMIVVIPDTGGQAENPLSVSHPVLANSEFSLRADTNDSRIRRVVNGAPQVGPLHAIAGTVVLYESGYPMRNVTATSHAWGHVLGLGDAVKIRINEGGSSPGAYSMMNPILPLDEPGYVAYRIIDHPSRARLGWVDPVMVTANLRDAEIRDAIAGGTVFRIPVATTTAILDADVPPWSWEAVAKEYFVVAYEDGHSALYGAPATGLYIWHCLDFAGTHLGSWHSGDEQWDAGDLRCDFMSIDLEVATGRFSDPGSWQEPDTEYGYDTLDWWPREWPIDVPPPGRDFMEYWHYAGSASDLFSALGNKEFSYRNSSNPSSRRYGTTANALAHECCSLYDPIVGYRELCEPPYDHPQTVETSVMVRIKDALPDGAIADILVAPYETVTVPNGGEVLQVRRPSVISWSREFTADQPDGIIATADIHLVRDGAADLLIASGVDATLGAYEWTPSAVHVGDNCKIRIVCHNVNDAMHVGEDESDEAFAVVDMPTVAKFTDVSGQTGISYSGLPHSGVAGDFQVDERKDLVMSCTDGLVALFAGSLVLPSGSPYFGGPSQSLPLANGRGIAVADYDNDGDQDVFVAHATTPRLYRNNGAGLFADVTASAQLATLAAGSIAACWGDYDKDGWLDLYVTRGAISPYGSEPPDVLNIVGDHPRLFHNNGATGNGFTDVTAAAGLSNFANSAVSASWGDMDGDGDLDLVAMDLAEFPLNNHLLLVNQGDGTFLNERMQRMYYQGFDPLHVTGAVLADMDNDGNLDIVFSCAASGSGVVLNDGTGHFHGEDMTVLPSTSGAVGTCFSGVQVMDHDLDGWQDILLVSMDATKPSRFYSTQRTGTDVDFVENTNLVGLSGSSKAMGSDTADFTRDGDFDLFVGRAISDGQYFYKTDRYSGESALGRNYVKLRLSSPFKGNNRLGIGATVTVTAGDLVQTQTVDGGSGRGGQSDRELIFGLGNYWGAVTAEVKWPCGFVQSAIPLTISNATAGDMINTIVDETMVISNLTVSTIIIPGTSTFDWVFSWETNGACDPSADILTFDQAGMEDPCWPGWTTVTPATSGIGHTYEPKPGGGYLHKFTFYGVECALCRFRYWASSAMGINQATSPTKSKRVTFCPSGF